jgi:glycosyltransferase
MGTAADYELMLRFLLKHGASARYIPEILVKMRTGGASNISLHNRLRANRMDRKAWEVNKLKPFPWTLCLKPLSKLTQYIKRPDAPN